MNKPMRHALPLLLALSTSALVAGCDGDSVRISATRTDTSPRGVLKVIDTLQCPETIGVLTRKGSALAEGSVCSYSGPKGAEVSLHLVRLDGGSSDEVLDAFEKRLSADLPHTVAVLEADKARAEAEAAKADAEAAKADADAARADAEAASADAGDRVTVSGPGMNIKTEGDRANVSLPGLNVQAEGDTAKVRIGGFSINASDSSSQVQISSPDESVSVQTRDDATEVRTRAPGDAVRSTYILTDSSASNAGWRLVGYEARGPAGGPIVVATIRSRERERDATFEAAQDLVKLNVGE